MNERMWIRADLHTHAIGDGQFGAATPDLVAAHVDAAVETGLRCIGVTDHDDLRPGFLAEEYAAKHSLPLLVLPGMEITTDEGHLVALGLREPLPQWKSMTETVERVHEQQAISILPHPFFPRLRSRRDVHAIERYNSRYGDFDVDSDTLAIVANSDAHSAGDLRSSEHHTLINLQCLSWIAIAEAIRERRVEAV